MIERRKPWLSHNGQRNVLVLVLVCQALGVGMQGNCDWASYTELAVALALFSIVWLDDWLDAKNDAARWREMDLAAGRGKE